MVEKAISGRTQEWTNIVVPDYLGVIGAFGGLHFRVVDRRFHRVYCETGGWGTGEPACRGRGVDGLEAMELVSRVSLTGSGKFGLIDVGREEVRKST